jgi:predicted RNase H-like HicB family nuclease
MLFPVCIHKDADSSYGVTIPDIPGCFTAGDTLDEAIGNVQEAIECHLEGEDMPAPVPSNLAELLHDPVCDGGTWVMVDVDLGFLEKNYKRVNISLSVHDLKSIDRYAKNRKMSRSAFLARAARKIIKENSL